ncbi:putative major facilitator transporter [Bordetella holmesii ATCC 51541]|nr:putative major facilitator transporter [Bordetella holmesii ATCC 51541]
MYYVFVPVCALILVWRVRPSAVTGLHQVDEAPVHFVPMPDTLQSSPAMVTLDPRVDVEVDPAMEMLTPEADVVQPPAPAAEPPAGTAAFDNVVAEPGEAATVLPADGAVPSEGSKAAGG